MKKDNFFALPNLWAKSIHTYCILLGPYTYFRVQQKNRDTITLTKP